MNLRHHTAPPSGTPSPRPFRMGEGGEDTVAGTERLSPAARVARLAWFDLASGATCRALAAAARGDGGGPFTPIRL